MNDLACMQTNKERHYPCKYRLTGLSVIWLNVCILYTVSNRVPYLQAFSSLHPECEFIFQLEEEERSCLQYIEEQANRSTEGVFPIIKSPCSPTVFANVHITSYSKESLPKPKLKNQ